MPQFYNKTRQNISVWKSRLPGADQNKLRDTQSPCSRMMGCWYVLSPTYFPMSYDGVDSVFGKKILFWVPNCKPFLVTEDERKLVRRRARFQQHRDTSCHQDFFSCKAPKEIRAFLIEILGEHAQSYATIKYWVAQFKHGNFYTCVAPRSGRPKTATTPEIIDQIHELIVEDRSISAKSIAE